ncbi:NADPH-dependent 2,4-dienoyl-CoA reductase/sulfur reductase-like enzyme [Hypnocyclicus thermotrophus]|uniref:NADPH-dependent 2,4-dienoyl-CoA reductase/sulfur reductase-like enzyme n=1 Tax=Hypnocyclicus thermotrophus TaxID=1627895 RepID=A0AA46E0A4_9FUSO|nr:FAD-dependent oxidoreductase [Hypnocyclicus thermotrophus]TDT72484.1 NADPH-dependent 2,4-dienoyl-CoA reductase/sulfur reductase-like enzyme [Hypnocyclicus thermotrophus]
MKVIIIGGVAGGASAAARLRRISEETEIIMIERGDYISFANCGLPYHIGGVIKERDNLLVQTVKGMKERFNIDVRVKTEAIKIDTEKKVVILKNLETSEEYEESYDKLLLSPGASPIKPPIKGINDVDNVYTLRNMNDMDDIIEGLKTREAKRAVVIGAGFIGVEVAENLKHKGLKVSIIEKANQILTPMDFDIAAQLHLHLKEQEVELYLNNGVTEFRKNGDKTTVVLENGDFIDTDIVILSIGVRPEVKLVKEANLEIGETGGIKVNEYMQTSNKDIYAVGDAIEVNCFVSNKKILVPLAWPANRQGRLVADNMLGLKQNKYIATMGTAIAKVFDMTAASTGLNEKTLKRYGIKYRTLIVNKNDHAGYYPGSTPIVLKLVYNEETGTIYGAQGIGYNGVDKRIDVIATAMKGGIKAWDLQDLELAYAPPFNSAKDPINFFGYIAENIKNGELKHIEWHELKDLDPDKSVLLDIRTKEENMLGTIPGSIHIDLNELRKNLDKLNKEKEYIVYCAIGVRGFLAYRILVQNGFKARNLNGGYKFWYPTTVEQSNIGIFKNDGTSTGIDNYITENDGGMHVAHAEDAKSIEVDACGLQCPGPIMKTFKTIEELKDGDILSIKATDPGFKKDVVAWANKTGNRLLEVTSSKGIITAKIQKNTPKVENTTNAPAKTLDGQTIVVFSGDLDKVLASFIIANGAIAMGKKVSMFFTFWGLTALKKDGVKVKKSGLAKMFDIMLPKHVGKLPISKMNMGGMGAEMIKLVMKKNNVDSVETLMKQFLDNGGKIIACQMSMDLMGIKEEELIDGVEIGGVATYLGDSENANSNLFI